MCIGGDITEKLRKEKKKTYEKRERKSPIVPPSRLSDYDCLVVFAQDGESLGTSLLLFDPHHGVLLNSIQTFRFTFITPPQNYNNTF